MIDTPNFFGDPKVIVSLLALITSIISLILSSVNQRKQNRKWDKLNLGNPEIREIRLINWKELSLEEIETTLWGYDPLIYSLGEASNRFILPYCLTLRNMATNDIIPNTNPAFTLAEIEKELNRINFTGEYLICRLFKPKIEIENMGKTELKDLTIDIDAKISDVDWIRVHSSNVKINLASSQKSCITLSFEIPIDKILPEKIIFKLNFQHLDDKDKIIRKVIGAKWTSNDNFWSYETISI